MGHELCCRSGLAGADGAGLGGCRRFFRMAGLAPDFENRGDVAEEDAGHLAPLVDLGDAGGALLVLDGDLVKCEAMAMRARHEFPPEAFLHFAEFLRHDLGDGVAHEDVGTARVVHGCVKYGLIEKKEETGEDSAHERIGTVDSPADDDVGRVASVPELLEVARITLAIGIEAQEILGFAHLHAFAHRFGVAFASVTQVEADRQFGSQGTQDFF